MFGTIRMQAILGMVVLWSARGVLADDMLVPPPPDRSRSRCSILRSRTRARAPVLSLSMRETFRSLKQSTDEAKRILSETGHYDVVDTRTVAQHDLLSCGRCEGQLAQKLGAEQAMIGLVTRITRTEYTIQIRVIDAATKETASLDFTGLRMGANYSWPRGVRWLMKNRTLASPAK